MKKTLLTLLACGGLLTSTLGFANEGSMQPNPTLDKPPVQCPCKPMDRMEWHNRGMMDPLTKLSVKLNLTQEQRDTIRADMDKLRPQIEKYQDQLIDSKQNLRHIMKEGKYDNATVAKYADLQGDAISHLIQLRFQSKQELMKVLTPEQQKQFKEMKKHHHEEWRK